MHVLARLHAFANLNYETLEDHLSTKIEPLENFPLYNNGDNPCVYRAAHTCTLYSINTQQQLIYN